MDNENRLEVEDLTLPRPNIQSPDTDANAAEMQNERKRILGDKYDEDRIKLTTYEDARRAGEFHPEDGMVGTPPDQVEAEFAFAESFKEKVVDKTREILNKSQATSGAIPPPRQTPTEISDTSADTHEG